ncbi:hypothetical protein SLEP1_g19181 [Rubroshorea leprosula]|nr:hypothetical protein SLEP1_g19181 [Rubroshorea leprosula]
MATVASASDQVSNSLEKLSLDSQTKNTNVTGAVKEGYHYMQYGTDPASKSPLSAMGQDGQPQMLQEYHYPGSFYQLPAQTSNPDPNAIASQVEVSTSSADQGSLSVEASKRNPGTVANAGGMSGSHGPRQYHPTFQNPSLNQNGSYRRGSLPARNPSPTFQDPRFSYDGNLFTMPWFDNSISSSGQSKHAVSAGFSSYSSNSMAGRNQNLHLYPQYVNGSTSGLSQAYGFMNHIYPNNMTYGNFGNTVGVNSGLESYGYDSWKKGLWWYPVGNNSKPKGRGYGKENIDGLNEMNRGPRVTGYKNQTGFEPVTAAVKGHNGPLSENNKENNLSPIPDMEQYNKEDFPESYLDVKFFVIKSYSEDDVHKSIKYGVWASTSNGNKKLDAAYHEAKEKPDGCPVFLLFSVNSSGQFVGLAEMVGPVDFDKTLEYWQQDKWLGCFPVKWHIIKDVPNSLLRHITLENNENKPVTNSRDTQEVNFEQGIQILKIFKGHSSKTCILDDFEFYESRQKIMRDKKAKHQLSQKQVLGQPSNVVTGNSDKAAIDKDVLKRSLDAALIEESTVATTAEKVKENGEVKPLEENGSVADVPDVEGTPAKPVRVASAC